MFLQSLPILLNGGVLFEDIPLSGEYVSDNGYTTMSDILILSKKSLTLVDLQSAVYRYCAFVEGPQADVRNIRKAIHTLTQLVDVIHGFYGDNPPVVRRNETDAAL